MNADPTPSLEIRTRVASGVVLIAAVVLALVAWPFVFAILVAAGALFALHEWHRLVNGGKAALEAVPGSLSIVAVIGLELAGYAPLWSVTVLFLGAALAALVAVRRGSWVLWHAVGVIYIGITVLALMLLRARLGSENFIDGRLIVGGVFAAVWTADTGALFVGRLLGGPRLAPVLSPKKTWAGLLGGVILAGLAETIYVAVIGGPVLLGGVFGVFLGVAANGGDLFESWVKRVFQTKNSGNLIPGHGGMLDRIDSLLLAAPAAVAFLFLFGDSSLFGVNS